MRITNRMLSNSFLADMRSNLENMQTLQQQLTSGKEIRKPSDDPFKVARSMQLHTDINENKQYNENINDTINWLDTTDTALGQVGDVLHRVRELLISSGNAAYSQDERNTNRDEINEKVGELAQILNTSFDGKYIFGGTRGTTKPVETTGGIEYKDAFKVDVDLKKLNEELKKGDVDIKLNEGKNPNETITLKQSNTGFKNISEFADELNKQINSDKQGVTPATPEGFKDKLKVVPNISDNSIMFLYEGMTGLDEIAINSNKIPELNGKILKTEVDHSNDNTELVYYRKDGGSLRDINVKDSEDQKQYNMINQKMTVQISQGVKMDYNVTASEVLEFKNEQGEDKDLKTILTNIVNHLGGKSDDGTTLDKDAIKKIVGSDLDDITDAMNNVLKVRSEVGAKQNRMESAKNKNVDANFNMTEILSKVEDIDITEKMMEYATMLTVYMASLQTSAKVIQPSLLDYLR